MPTHGEMGVDAVRTELPHQALEAEYVELKNQGEAHQHRFNALDGLQDFFEGVLKIEDLNRIATRPQCGSKIPQAKVPLALESNQHHRLGGITRARNRVLKIRANVQ
jgi:hypothetical protein